MTVQATVPRPFDPSTLPVNDNLNPYCFCVDLAGEWFMQKGKMIAYYGTMRFEALMATTLSALVAQHFSSPLYVQDWVVATGQGKLLLGDRGYDINSYNLEDGNLTVRAANLLAFEPRLELKQSIVPGFLTLLGTGTFLASSNGPVIFIDPPVRVDPQALVGWADCPSPSVHHDLTWMGSFLGAAQAAFGRRSGEEEQFDFTGAGTVLMQSSEKVLEDPAVLKQVEAQLDLLSADQLDLVQRSVQARMQR